MASLARLSDFPLIHVIRHVGTALQDLLPLLQVSKAWNARFDSEDEQLWTLLAVAFRITLRISKSNLSLRNRHKFNQLFIKAYYLKQKEMRERHDLLIINARSVLLRPLDSPKQLQKLIAAYFPDAADFDANWRCSILEDNCLLTLSARMLHLRTMKLLVERLGANINQGEVGGFNALILCAYHGFFEGVRYCIRRGADFRLVGRLRSGLCLTAEHWAAVQGHQEIFNYLRAIRLREEHKAPRQETTGDAIRNALGSLDDCGQQLLLFAMDSLARSRGPNAPPLVPPPPIVGGNSFCICGRGFDGQMIACDNSHCTVEWFHFECVGLEQAPDGDWFCPACRGDSFSEPLKKKRRVTGARAAGASRRRLTNAPQSEAAETAATAPSDS